MSIDTLANAIARKSITDRVIQREQLVLASQMQVPVKAVQAVVNAAVREQRGRPYNGPVDFSCRRNWFFDTH